MAGRFFWGANKKGRRAAGITGCFYTLLSRRVERPVPNDAFSNRISFFLIWGRIWFGGLRCLVFFAFDYIRIKIFGAFGAEAMAEFSFRMF
jgi:hypothetical protein